MSNTPNPPDGRNPSTSNQSDIVERLRGWSFISKADLLRLIEEAADAIERLRKERDEYRDVLSGLALYYSAGSGDETTTAEQYDKRVRDGVDILLSGFAQLCVNQCRPRDGEAWTRGAMWTGDLIAARISKFSPSPKGGEE